ncbi:MAG: hypothetical protein ACI81R_000656 [Bradymonadia bacterium]|jgi:hypothetical protein
MKYALRVAVMWHGTTMQEMIVRSGRVTIGGQGSLLLLGDEETLELAEIDGDSATIFPLPGMTGRLVSGEHSRALLGAASSELRPGDAAMLHLGEITFYLQWVEDDLGIRALGWLGVFGAGEGAFGSSAAVSATAHGVSVILAFLLAKPSVSPVPFDLRERWVSIIVDEPPGTELLDEIEPLDEIAAAPTDPEAARDGHEIAESDIAEVNPDASGAAVEVEGTSVIGPNDRRAGLATALTHSAALTNIFSNTSDMQHSFGADFQPTGNQRGDGIAGLNGPGPGGLRGRVGGTCRRCGPVGGIGGDGREVGGTQTTRRDARTPVPRMRRLQPVIREGFLTRQQIEGVVRRHSRGMRSCYESALIADGSLAGSLSFSWTIGLDGRVSGARAVEDSIGNGTLASCLGQEIRRMRFPQPDGGMVVVTYPFRFDLR